MQTPAARPPRTAPVLPPLPDDLADQFRSLIEAGRSDEVVRQSEGISEKQLRDRPELELEVARALARTGRFDRAVARATTALWGFRVKRDATGQLRANLTLGGIAFEQGHVRTAEHHLGLVRVLAVTLDDRPTQAKVTNNLACLSLQRGDFPAAADLLQSALALTRDLNDLRGQAEVWHNLNTTNRGMGRFDEARSAGREAVVLGERLGDWSMLAMALAGLAETEVSLGIEPDPGLLDRGEDSARKADDPVRGAQIGRVRAMLALHRRDPSRAAELASAAQDQAARYGADLLAAECTAIIALAKRRLGEVALAGQFRSTALVAFDRLRAYRESEWFEKEWVSGR